MKNHATNPRAVRHRRDREAAMQREARQEGRGPSAQVGDQAQLHVLTTALMRAVAHLERARAELAVMPCPACAVPMPDEHVIGCVHQDAGGVREALAELHAPAVRMAMVVVP